MNILMSLITGPIFALLMMSFGIATIVSVPVCFLVLLVSLMFGRRSVKFYVWTSSIPLLCLAGTLSIFTLRSVVGTFYAPPDPQPRAPETTRPTTLDSQEPKHPGAEVHTSEAPRVANESKEARYVALEILVDKSRSMALNDQLNRVKATIHELLQGLPAQDSVGIIAFDHIYPLRLVPLGLVGERLEAAEERIERIFPAGRSKLLPSLHMANNELSKSNTTDKVILIFTDMVWSEDVNEITTALKLSSDKATVFLVPTGNSEALKTAERIAATTPIQIINFLEPKSLSSRLVTELEGVRQGLKNPSGYLK